MGWLWSSNASSSSNENSKAIKGDASLPSQDLAGSIATGSTPAPPTKPLSREEQADREFESFLASLEGAGTQTKQSEPQAQSTTHTRITSSHTNPTKYEPIATEEAPPHSSPTTTTTAPDNEPLDISPQALYPRTMSCRQLFDQAFYCQSLGGKFNDIYRYGSLQSCSDNWDAFWFCMRTRTYPDHEKEPKIAEWYKQKELRNKAAKGSSEDVWEIRTVPVEKAFWRDPDEEGGGRVVRREG